MAHIIGFPSRLISPVYIPGPNDLSPCSSGLPNRFRSYLGFSLRIKAIWGIVFWSLCSLHALYGQTSIGNNYTPRHIPLEGTRNTRSLDGIPTRQGKIRPGLLYRSGALCFITRHDIKLLNRLHLRTIVELRLPQEIARDGPDKPELIKNGIHLILLPMRNSHGIHQEAYKAYMHECGQVFHDFFRLLAHRKNYPLLFHCSAGKDRTGILTALLLMALGTPKDVIIDDYLQSQRNSPRLLVKPEWIEVVFDFVRRRGGIIPYLHSIGVTDRELSEIRAILVEPIKTEDTTTRFPSQQEKLPPLPTPTVP